MAHFNQVLVIGRLDEDPQLAYATSGIPVCHFSLATARKRLRPDGSEESCDVHVHVSARRRLAEICAQFLRKGSEVFVAGPLEEEPGGDRRNRTGLRIQAETVQFLSDTARVRTS